MHMAERPAALALHSSHERYWQEIQVTPPHSHLCMHTGELPPNRCAAAGLGADMVIKTKRRQASARIMISAAGAEAAA